MRLSLEYEPEGLVEKIGDKLNVVENQAERDLERFKKFIESEGYASRGLARELGDVGVGTLPGVEDAATPAATPARPACSPKVVAAGVGVAAAAAAAAVAAGGSSTTSEERTPESDDTIPYRRLPYARP